MKKLLNKIPNWIIGVYIIWFTLHLIFLIVGPKLEWAANYFLPFTKYYNRIADYYDFSEFIIYICLPLLITVALYFFFGDKLKWSSSSENDLSRLIEILDEQGMIYKDEKTNLISANHKPDAMIDLMLNMDYNDDRVNLILQILDEQDILTIENFDKRHKELINSRLNPEDRMPVDDYPQSEGEDVQDSEEEYYCPRCQAIVTPEQKFCLECGEKLKFHCCYCGHLCDLQLKECSNCEVEFNYGDPSFDEGLINDREKFCEKCNEPSDSSWDYCINCGTKFSQEDLDDEDNF